MGAQCEPPVGEGGAQAVSVRPGGALGGGEAAYGVEDVGGGGVGDVVRVRLDVQDRAVDTPVGEQVGDQQQVGDEFTAGVVGDEAEGAGPGGVEQGPQAVAVVGDEGGDGGGLLGALGGHAEAEVGAVAPEEPCSRARARSSSGRSSRASSAASSSSVAGASSSASLAGRKGSMPCQGRARSSRRPGAVGGRTSSRTTARARRARSGRRGRPCPRRPSGRGRGRRRAGRDRALGAVLQQGVERAALPGAVGGVLGDLAEDRGVPFGQHAVREGAGLVGDDHGGGGVSGMGLTVTRRTAGRRASRRSGRHSAPDLTAGRLAFQPGGEER